MSATSELEFHSNEATAGSITDHDLLSAEGEDDEETLSADACGSPVKIIKNDLSRRSPDPYVDPRPDPDLYGLSYHETKDTFYKDIPSSSKNYNMETDKDKCSKVHTHCNLDSLSLQIKDTKKGKKHELLNNGSRRYSDSSAYKSNLHPSTSGSRFTTTLVSEDPLSGESPRGSKSNNDLVEADSPLVTKANSINIKPGFNITDA